MKFSKTKKFNDININDNIDNNSDGKYQETIVSINHVNLEMLAIANV